MHNALNGFHPNLKFSVENEPPRFLDSEFEKNEEDRTFSLRVFHKPNKFPIHWSSQTPRRYKKNALLCELHRAFVISDNFDEEVIRIRSRYREAGFPQYFLNEIINDFTFSRQQRIIPEKFFDDTDETPILRLRLPFCWKNENLTGVFLKKLYSYIGNSFKVFIIWNTTKIRSLFPLKDRNLHPNCVVYEGTCSCGNKYIGETAKCIHLRIAEHEDVKKVSEPSKHLKENGNHAFTWLKITNAPRDFSKRKILEALYISKFKPSLNDQIKSRKLRLFVNGVT